MSAVQRAAAVEELFPPGVIAFEIRGPAPAAADLFPVEREHMANAVASRVREFAAGRSCARAGLAVLGAMHAALPPGPDRRPQWPSGVVGSISHTHDYCVAVLGRTARFSAIGVDAERVQDVDPSVWPLTLRAEEIARLDGLDERARQRHAAIAYCAKEAFYKFQYELTRSWLDFEDVSVDAVGHAFEVTVHAPSHAIHQIRSRWSGKFSIDDTLVIAAIAAEQPAPTR